MAPRLLGPMAAALPLLLLLLQGAAAQLSGTVGPTTSTSAKAATKVCNIMDYGGTADASADNGDAIAQAWSACASGGQVYIPEGDYGLATWLSLKDGRGVSINLEGTLYRTGADSGNMISVESSSDFEFYSATGKGAVQAYGYEFHKDGEYGARIFRCTKCEDFSVHDLILVDAPQFHVSLDTCSNGEVYNMIIHGGYQGGLDGIDVWGSNIWIHDIEVSNKDECVTVKDPSSNILVEQVHCNWSGGCAMGSLASGIDIHDIEYNYIYTHHSNQMYMIKSNGGDGDVYNLAFNNFMGHSNAYTLDFDTAWSSMDAVSGNGIQYSNISFDTWTGTATDGTERGPIKINCPEATVCTDITVSGFSVWTDSDDDAVLYGCQNAYGSGACLQSGDANTAYTTTQTVSSAGDYSYSTMDNELTTGYDVSASIPIPTMPASFYPGRQPISAILSGSAQGSASGAASAAAAAAATSGNYGASGASSSFTTSYAAAAAAATSEASADLAQPSGQGWGQQGSSSDSGSEGSWGEWSGWNNNAAVESSSSSSSSSADAAAITPAPASNKASCNKQSAKLRRH